MDITIDDFNTLAAERSSRDVKIAQMEMEMQMMRIEHEREKAVLVQERDGMWEENNRLKRRLELLETNFENLRFENHWMKQYILLSIERVRAMFSHIHDIKMLSAVKAFILDMLPADATPEQVALASNAMALPVEKPATPVHIEGDYVVEKHVGQQVNGVESGATGIYIQSDINKPTES